MSTLNLHYTVTPESLIEVTAEYPDESGRSQLAVYPHHPEYAEVLALSARAVEALTMAREGLGDTLDDAALEDAVTDLEALRAVGEQLRDLLLPGDLLDLLGKRRDLKTLVFRCNPLLNGVPFDLVYLWDDFLCFLYATGKRLLARVPLAAAPPPSGGEGYRGFSIADPGGDFDETRACEEFERFRLEWAGEAGDVIDFRRLPCGASVGGEEVGEALRHRDFVNFLCHHSYVEEDPEASGYSLGEEIFTARRMLECLSAGARPPHLILSMSCESGVTRGWEASWPGDERLHGMVDAALRAGVRHFVSTLIQVPVERSARVFLPFYRAIAAGATVGEALRQARRALRLDPANPLDGGTLLGLPLVLYGDPSEAYFCAEGHRTDAGPAVACAAVDEQGDVCARIVCPREAGFGHRRCDRHREAGTLTCSAGHEVAGSVDLEICRQEGCLNTCCARCAGQGEGLCWRHACQHGHEIRAGAAKVCPDEQTLHPDRPRTVCPLDKGWIRGVCDECLAQDAAALEDRPVCPHSGAYITGDNPVVGVCADCGRQLCGGSECGGLHERTLYCPDTTRSSGERDRGWRAALERRSEAEPDLASPDRLRGLLPAVEVFHGGLQTNLSKVRWWHWRPMPRLAALAREVLGPQARVRRVATGHADLSERLRSTLRDGWRLPADLSTGAPWTPPGSWLAEWRGVNRMRVHLVKGLWGPPVLVAVATLAPVDFRPGRGPVLVPCDAGHLEAALREIREWWAGERRRRMPDSYLVIASLGGWKEGVKPVGADERSLTVLARLENGVFKLDRPRLDGFPPKVRAFVADLSPETMHDRLAKIREWTEHYLEAHESVRWTAVQDGLSFPAERDEILAAFAALCEKWRFAVFGKRGKETLRWTTREERTRRFVRRRWVEMMGSAVGAIGSYPILRYVPSLWRWLPLGPWPAKLVMILLCVAICTGLGHSAKKLAGYLSRR